MEQRRDSAYAAQSSGEGAGRANTVMRIAAGDDRTHYDRVAQSLHWLTALLVIAQFVLAQTWEDAARPTRHTMIVAHMSFGILLAVVVAFRIVWRLIPGHQMPAIVSGWVEIASKAMHYLLYSLLIVQAGLGFALRWGGNEAMNFFGLLIPSPISPLPKPARHLIGDAHNYIGWAIIILAAAHAAAALYHHFMVKDDVLARMLPGAQLRRRQTAA